MVLTNRKFKPDRPPSSKDPRVRGSGGPWGSEKNRKPNPPNDKSPLERRFFYSPNVSAMGPPPAYALLTVIGSIFLPRATLRRWVNAPGGRVCGQRMGGGVVDPHKFYQSWFSVGGRGKGFTAYGAWG